MGGLKMPKDLLTLGRTIVEELDLPRRGATLERWMAHEVAGLLEREDGAENAADRSAAGDRASRLILELWSRRWSLPEGFGPVSGYRKAIEMLYLLDADTKPLLRRGAAGEELSEMFDVLSRCLVGALLLAIEPYTRDVTAVESEALGEDEMAVVSLLERWRKRYVALASLPSVRFVRQGEVVDTKDPGGAEEGLDEEGDNTPDEDQLRAAILEDLEGVQKRLSGLLDRWRDRAR